MIDTITTYTQPALFYMFSAVMLGAALGVVFSRNPVHSVMFLVLTFFPGCNPLVACRS